MSLRPQLRRAQPESSTDLSKSNSRIPTKSIPESAKPSRLSSDASKVARRVSRSNLPVPDAGTRDSTRAQPPRPSAQRRLSNIPSAIATPSYSQDALYPPSAMRTPSLISGGSSVTTFDSPKSQGLRRKPSGAIDKFAAQKRGDSVDSLCDTRRVSDSQRIHAADFDDSVLGISLPPASNFGDRKLYAGSQSKLESLDQPELSRLITPPILPYPPSTTPSTRYTDSPFSHVPTPSSASSYSPATVAYAGITSSPVQLRSPVSARKNSRDIMLKPGLAPVRESSTSSSKASVRSLALKTEPAQENTIKASEARKTVTRRKLVKAQPAMAIAKPTVQAPPELAHLRDNPSPSKASQKPPPPARPSRDGTPNIDDLNTPSPVVQSDLPRLYTTYHKRKPSSQDTPLSAESPNVRSRLGFSPKLSSSSFSPRVDSAISPPPLARKLSRNATTDSISDETTSLQRKDTPAVTSSSPAKSRFGFFSRKPKVETPKLSEKPKRLSTKGPAAGTGHEGYARFGGVRGRGGSIASSTGLRSPSADSSTSSLPLQPSNRKGSNASKDGSEMDSFLRERLRPVILRGSGSTSNTAISNSTSSVMSTGATSRISTSSQYSPPKLLPPVMQSSMDSPTKKQFSPIRKEKPSANDGPLSNSTHSLPLANGNGNGDQDRLTDKLPHNPLDSVDVMRKNAPANLQHASSDGVLSLQEGQWFGSRKVRPLTPVEQKRNFSQRVQSSPRPRDDGHSTNTPFSIGDSQRALEPSIVAHYALTSPVYPVDLDEVKRIVQENDVSADESQSESGRLNRLVPYEGRHVGLLPAPTKEYHTKKLPLNSQHPALRNSAPKPVSSRLPQGPDGLVVTSHGAIASAEPKNRSLVPKSQPVRVTQQQAQVKVQPAVTPEMPQDTFGAHNQGNTTSPPRLPRLSPVGRIPRVVSKRDRDRKLPDNSFSRPFARAQPRPSVKPPGSVYSQIREMASPIESLTAPAAGALNSLKLPTVNQVDNLRARNGLSVERVSTEIYEPEEFFNLPARKDSGQSFSSSSGYPSWIAPVDIQPQQEDVWNEFDEFMDEVIPLRNSQGTSLGTVLQYGEAPNGPYRGHLRIPSLVGAPPTGDLPLPPGYSSEPMMLSLQQQVARFLQPSLSPLSSERFSGARFSFSSIHDSVSSRYSRASIHSRSTSLPESNVRNSQLTLASNDRFNRETRLLDIAEVEPVQMSSAKNLRIPALMTSKWLSFGRVLFSPAHNEMTLAENPRVLIVDELSSDWSHFVALTYPSGTVYNLSTANSSSQYSELQQQKPPPNHRQITVNSFATQFPFPKGFFNAVVFRFPKATTESTHQSVISECKRVLRPGGFLETVILDLDLMNMGTEVRRALRGLKTRMQQQDREICLSNLSDVMVRLIGRRGFEGIQRCVVGVPAAGRIPRSQDSSSISSDGCSKPIWHTEDHDEDGREFSFADLVDQTQKGDLGSDKGSDESITKMVAKVGRWWYSSCYEESLLPTDQSIWSDRALLRECEKQGTSFRLLICHAQKPAQPRRRTVSV